MLRRMTLIIGSMATLGMLLGVTSGEAVAQMAQKNRQPAATAQARQFQRLEQPLWLKGAVTAGGLGLIGLELWWFLFSKPKSHQAR